MGLWKQAHDTLKLNHREISSQHWKGLLDFANEIRVQLEQADIEIDNLSDKQLEDEIQRILHGGSISSQPLSKGSSSIWCWLRRSKWWVVSYILTMALMLSDITMIYPSLWVRLPSLFTICLFVAFAIGSTAIERGLLFVIGAALCYPMGSLFVFNTLLLPGVILGIFLVSAVGSTKGSCLVLFILPFLCNYIPFIIWIYLSRG